MKFELLPLRLTYSDEFLPFEKIRLMSHQAEMKFCDNKLITITAPTGSGKTLAFLMRIVETEKSGIIILPTNELIEDQTKAICSLLTKLGKTVYVPSASNFDGKNGNNEDYAVIVATGSQLEELTGAPTRSKGFTLAKLLSVNAKNTILITNPDTLHLVFRGAYSRVGEIFQDLLKFKTLVIDEFHLYCGTTLANLVFILAALRRSIDQLIIATATPSDILPCLQDIFGESEAITSRESNNGHIVRQRLQLRILQLPQNHILSDEKDAEIVAEHIGQLYLKNQNSDAPIITLVIVNSIAFCIRLSKKLKENFGEKTVSAIHALVPKKDRETLRRKPIVIGTSALEVGIDFDVASIFVEANNAPAFVQRLGRAARRREADGIAMIPTEGMLYLKEHSHSAQLTYSEFKNLIYSSLNTPLTYSAFMQSKEAALLYAGFLYGLLNIGKAKEQELLTPDALLSLVKEPFWQLPFIDMSELEHEARCFRTRKLRSIAQAGFRGYLNNLPVFLKNFNRVIRVGFFDLPMLSIEGILTKEELEQKCAISGKGIGDYERIIIAKEFMKVPIKLRAKWGEEDFRDIEFITRDKLSLTMKNSGYSQLFFRLIENLPAYSTSQRPDWRFPSIKHETDTKWVVVGLDAYLQKYLDKHQD